MDQIRHKVAIVGAAETDDLGTLPGMSRLALHAQAARNALNDAGLKLSDVDGLLCAGAIPNEVAEYLGIQPRYIDGTSVGGLLVHDPRAPRRGSDHGRLLRCRADHPRRERTLPYRHGRRRLASVAGRAV